MSKFLKKTTLLLFALANIVLTAWIILFKGRVLPSYVFFHSFMRTVNFVPSFNETETLLNAVIFIPLGIFVALLTRKNIAVQTLSVAAFSFSLELAQYVLAYGTADVTDLISNTVGGLIGIILCRCMRGVFKAEGGAVCGTLACIATAAMYPAAHFFL